MIRGAVAGPMSYYYGVQIGAIEMGSIYFSMLCLATVWGVTMPALLWLNERGMVRAVVVLVPGAPE